MLRGVGEEMPTELANVIPGYDEFLHGYTIGPIEKLKNSSPKDYAQYIRERLTLFQKIGWLTPAARRWYEDKLGGDDSDRILKQSEQDLKTEQITTEVFAMLQNLRRY